MWPGTHLRLAGAAIWPVLRPGGGRLLNHHCERQPRLVAIPAAHICKSKERKADTNQHEDDAFQRYIICITFGMRCIFDFSMASACEHVLNVQDSRHWPLTGTLQYGTVGRNECSQALHVVLLGYCLTQNSSYYTIHQNCIYIVLLSQRFQTRFCV